MIVLWFHVVVLVVTSSLVNMDRKSVNALEAGIPREAEAETQKKESTSRSSVHSSEILEEEKQHAGVTGISGVLLWVFGGTLFLGCLGIGTWLLLQ